MFWLNNENSCQILAPFLSEAVQAILYYFFRKLFDKTQISKPPEPTRHHNSIKLWILLSLRADLFYILQYETPCILFFLLLSWQPDRVGVK